MVAIGELSANRVNPLGAIKEAFRGREVEPRAMWQWLVVLLREVDQSIEEVEQMLWLFMRQEAKTLPHDRVKQAFLGAQSVAA